MGEIYLTRAGYQKLYDELEALKQERKDISKAIGEARLQGDISENAEYDAAKDAQAHNEARISELEAKLSQVKIIEDMNIPADKAYIGAIVNLESLEDKEEIEYMLVSAEEADFEQNKISIVSPLGKAMLGKAVGDTVEVNAPAGVRKYNIKSIKRP